MRILLMAPHFPYPPHGGALLRTWEMIRYLGARHQLTFVAIGPAAPSHEQLRAVLEHCEDVCYYRCNDQPNRDCPEAVAPWWSAELIEQINKLSEVGFDRVILEMVYLAHFGDCFSCPVVLAEHNIESVLFRHFAELKSSPAERLGWRAAALQLAAYEQKVWPKFALRTVVSPIDDKLLRERCGQRTLVVPNGADCSAPMLSIRPDSGRMLFAGLLNYQPNREAVFWLVEQVMPLIWKERPEYQLVIAGARPEPDLLALADGARIVFEISPSSMERIAESCSLMAVGLLRGSGSRIKILQSFAWGLPVVSTTAGCEGLEVEDVRHLWVRDRPQEFAQGVLDLVSQPSKWGELRDNARALCLQRYDWGQIWAAFETELLSLNFTGA